MAIGTGGTTATRFFGREQQLDAVRRALGGPGVLVTLLGPGGAGKTRLLAELTASARIHVPVGGIAHASIQDAHDLPSAAIEVAAALGMARGEPESIGAAIASRGPCLIVLDGVERLLPAFADVLQGWRRAAPDARFLVTSQVRLGLPGEVPVSVGPLETAEVARALLLDRVSAVVPGFAADADAEAAADRVAEALDRLPLALELAAARTAVLPLAQLADRLVADPRMSEPGPSGRHLPARHATLAATVSWSWDLLAEEDREALSQVAVMDGSFSVEAAEAVLGTGAIAALARLRAIPAEDWPAVDPELRLDLGADGPDVRTVRRRLQATGDLAAGPAPPHWDEALTQALAAFQTRHGLTPTGAVGPATAGALAVSRDHRIAQIEANLERWRWLPQEFGARSIVANIAAFSLTGRSPGQEPITMRVVVGRPYRRTPVFSGRMTYLVINPTWTVPPGILAADVLPAIRRDVSYLAKKRMVVYEGWGADARVVDPRTADWSKASGKGPYRIVQAPGPDNALGIVKFMFPNPYNVYLHDTPSKEGFAADDRAFSSGCIRLSEPAALTEWVLAGQPEGRPDTLKRLFAAGTERTVTLAKPVQVHLLYWTTWVDDAGTLQIRKDVYDRDGRLIAALAATAP